MNICVEVEINSPKNAVWFAITDFDNCVGMISAIIDLKVIDKPNDGLVGFKWSETRKMFGKEATETIWITDYKNEDYYSTRAENCGAIYTTKLSLKEKADKTLLTMYFSDSSDSLFVRIMSSVMGLFFKKTIVKLLQKDLDDIKKFVEKGQHNIES